MKALAIIPARGGSKGVTDKNIRMVAGKPLIAYAIECAQESRKLTKTIVSTDSPAIAEVATRYSAQVLLRPEKLAQDDTPMPPVLIHAVQELARQGEHFDIIVLLQVTSPIRTGEDVDKVISMFESDASLEGVISVVPMDDVHPARMYTLAEGNWMKPFLNQGEELRRQDLPVVYYRNGCIYAVRTEVLLQQKTLMPAIKKAYVMPVKYLANVDDVRDLIITETLVGLWKSGKL